MPGSACDGGPLAETLRRTPIAFVALDVRCVLFDRHGVHVLAQIVYDLRATASSARATLAAVHHSGLVLPPPATYEQVRAGVPSLAPDEVGRDLERHRGLRWLPGRDPGGRSWPLGSRLVRLVDGEEAGRRLAGHFAVPFVLDGTRSPE